MYAQRPPVLDASSFSVPPDVRRSTPQMQPRLFLIEAEKAFQRSVDLDPSTFLVHIELANLLLKRGASERAFGEYSQALLHAPAGSEIQKPIEMQIRLFSRLPANKIPILRNPGLE